MTSFVTHVGTSGTKNHSGAPAGGQKNMPVVIAIQARMASTRLPGKVMKRLEGREVLWHVVERCKKSTLAQEVLVVTSTDAADDVIARFCTESGIGVMRGSLNNVLERYHMVAKAFHTAFIVRITADCPLIDAEMIDVAIREIREKEYDYISTIVGGVSEFPLGFAIEVVSSEAIRRAYTEATEKYDKEHVTPYVYRSGKFNVGPLMKAPAPYKLLSDGGCRLTLDYPEDLVFFEALYAKLYKKKPITIQEVVQLYVREPDVFALNSMMKQKHAKK